MWGRPLLLPSVARNVRGMAAEDISILPKGLSEDCLIRVRPKALVALGVAMKFTRMRLGFSRWVLCSERAK
jgi:hypothetical protein